MAIDAVREQYPQAIPVIALESQIFFWRDLALHVYPSSDDYRQEVIERLQRIVNTTAELLLSHKATISFEDGRIVSVRCNPIRKILRLSNGSMCTESKKIGGVNIGIIGDDLSREYQDHWVWPEIANGYEWRLLKKMNKIIDHVYQGSAPKEIDLSGQNIHAPEENLLMITDPVEYVNRIADNMMNQQSNKS
jgi:hypothetical protein